jgi:hypothetical protein
MVRWRSRPCPATRLTIPLVGLSGSGAASLIESFQSLHLAMAHTSSLAVATLT